MSVSPFYWTAPKEPCHKLVQFVNYIGWCINSWQEMYRHALYYVRDQDCSASSRKKLPLPRLQFVQHVIYHSFIIVHLPSSIKYWAPQICKRKILSSNASKSFYLSPHLFISLMMHIYGRLFFVDQLPWSCLICCQHFHDKLQWSCIRIRKNDCIISIC